MRPPDFLSPRPTVESSRSKDEIQRLACHRRKGIWAIVAAVSLIPASCAVPNPKITAPASTPVEQGPDEGRKGDPKPKQGRGHRPDHDIDREIQRENEGYLNEVDRCLGIDPMKDTKKERCIRG
jgi:hypothetical protein